MEFKPRSRVPRPIPTASEIGVIAGRGEEEAKHWRIRPGVALTGADARPTDSESEGNVFNDATIRLVPDSVDFSAEFRRKLLLAASEPATKSDVWRIRTKASNWPTTDTDNSNSAPRRSSLAIALETDNTHTGFWHAHTQSRRRKRSMTITTEDRRRPTTRVRRIGRPAGKRAIRFDPDEADDDEEMLPPRHRQAALQESVPIDA
jgi:hypothetical protein